MRIIKLSKDDEEMQNRDMVRKYFEVSLPKKYGGKFLFKKGWIAEGELSAGEKVVFTYNGDLVYLGVAASERQDYTGELGWSPHDYPYYFLVDTNQLYCGWGSLADFESKLSENGLLEKNIVRSQGWPHLQDSLQLDDIWNCFKLD